MAAKAESGPRKDDDALLRVRVTLGKREYAQDLGFDAQTPIDLGGLNTALAGHPGKFAWWAMVEALARAQHEERIAQLARLDAELFAAYSKALLDKAQADTSGRAKAPTLDAINGQVIRDRRHIASQAEVAAAKLALDQVTVGRQTMQQRKDTLLGIASNMRAEMDARMFTVRSRNTTTYPIQSKAPGHLEKET